MIDLEPVHHLLAHCTEPSLGMNAEAMAVSADISEKDDKIQLNLSAGIPTGFLIRPWLETLYLQLEQQLGHEGFDFQLQQKIRSHQTQLTGMALKGVKNTIAVASGKGGVGKSTLTVNLAAALASQGARVGVLDADIYGPSMPLMLGRPEEVRVENDKYLPVRAHGLQVMSIGYLTDMDAALIWRGPMLAKSLLQMIDLTLWDELDYLFIDLPPGTGDIQLSLVQKIPLAGAVVVTTPQQVATLDAQKAITMFQKTQVPVLGLIENMANFHCAHCGHEEAIFGAGGAQALADKTNTPLLGQLPLAGQIRDDSDKGRPTALGDNKALSQTFQLTALRLAIELAKRPVNFSAKMPPVVVER